MADTRSMTRKTVFHTHTRSHENSYSHVNRHLYTADTHSITQKTVIHSHTWSQENNYLYVHPTPLYILSTLVQLNLLQTISSDPTAPIARDENRL